MISQHQANSIEYNEIDLQAFKQWLSNFQVPCPKCRSLNKIQEATIDEAKLSNDPQKPFHFNSDTYICSNPNCNATFSYSDSLFVKAFLKRYRK